MILMGAKCVRSLSHQVLPRSVIIKKINGKQTKQVYDLGKRAFPKETWLTREFVSETIHGSGVNLGAYENNKMVGTILVKNEDPPKSWIYYFVVDRVYRRQGIGTLLLKKAEKILGKKNWLMFVDLGDQDELAKRFYKRNKFSKVARIKNWFGRGIAGLIYSKELQ